MLTTTVQLAPGPYPAWPVVAQTHTEILDEIRQQPGVISAGSGNFLPLEVGWRVPFRIEGKPPPARPEDAPQAQYHCVSDGYFEALGASMLQGRTFAATDTGDSTGVVIVNESFAAHRRAARVRTSRPSRDASGSGRRLTRGLTGPPSPAEQIPG